MSIFSQEYYYVNEVKLYARNDKDLMRIRLTNVWILSASEASTFCFLKKRHIFVNFRDMIDF